MIGICKAEYEGKGGRHVKRTIVRSWWGVFGDPVDENPTGVMEEAAFEAKGLDYRYLTIRVRREDLPAAIQAVRAFGDAGYQPDHSA
ncbi:MAG: hypothetical protein ACOX6Y_02400 [Christensenellales bacterium]